MALYLLSKSVNTIIEKNKQPLAPRADWESLVVLLRKELQEYGGFMNLLKIQQERIVNRELTLLKDSEDQINVQIEKAFSLRKHREEMLNVISKTWSDQPMLSNFNKISIISNLNQFPEKSQPLLKALSDEINRLVHKIKKLLKQNQMLLSRASHVTEQILQKLNPKPINKTYDKGGGVSFKPDRPMGGLNVSV